MYINIVMKPDDDRPDTYTMSASNVVEAKEFIEFMNAVISIYGFPYLEVVQRGDR